MVARVGSILHGAYGDYYEQLVALRYYKAKYPAVRLIVFYASDLRMSELAVFDHSFAEEVHSHTALPDVPVDRFLQFQVRAEELRSDVLDRLAPEVLAKIDLRRNLKPWNFIRSAWRADPALCDIPLSDAGQLRLPEIIVANRIPPGVFDEKFTIGFLWRYRRPGSGHISHVGQIPSELILEERSALFRRLISELDAHILTCGMSVRTTDENRARTDNKYDTWSLDLPADRVTYLQGLSWGLELETLRRCDLCVVMASGFSEALWLKRRGEATLAVDTPPSYLKRLLWNRAPFFQVLSSGELSFQLRQPHTAEKVYRRLAARGLLTRRQTAGI